MPEIGASLREARLRAKLDIVDVESATKIRAKYLRALENEEFGLLPGSTFVRTFLRKGVEFTEELLRENDDLQVGFLAESCAEISRNEFVAAFNELLTSIARYASRIPIP